MDALFELLQARCHKSVQEKKHVGITLGVHDPKWQKGQHPKGYDYLGSGWIFLDTAFWCSTLKWRDCSWYSWFHGEGSQVPWVPDMGCHPEMERDAQIKTCYFPLLSFKSKQTCIFKDSPFIFLPPSGPSGQNNFVCQFSYRKAKWWNMPQPQHGSPWGGSQTKDIWQCCPVSACVFLRNGWGCERGRCQKVCGNLGEINAEPALPGKHVYGTQPPSDYDGVFAAGRFIVGLFCWKVLAILQQPGDIYKRCPISFQTAILCLVRAVWCFISGYLREENVSPVLQHQMGIYCYYRGSYAGCWLSAFGNCFGASFGCKGHWQVQDREGKTTGTDIGEWPQSEPWRPGRWGYQTIPNSDGEVEDPRPQGFGWSTFWNHYPSDAEDQRNRDAPFTFSQDFILFCAEGLQGDAFGPACLRQSVWDTGIFQWHSQSLNIEYVSVSVSGALHCFALVYPCFTVCNSSSRSSHY